MASYPTGVPVVGPEQCYNTWRAERDQMDARFHSSVLQLERQFADEQSRIQADFEGKQRTLPSGTATSPLMFQYLEDKRTTDLKKLQQLYHTRKQELEATHQQDRQVHLESFMHRMDATMRQVVPHSRNAPPIPGPVNSNSAGPSANMQPVNQQPPNNQPQQRVIYTPASNRTDNTQPADNRPASTQPVYNMNTPVQYDTGKATPVQYWKPHVENPLGAPTSHASQYSPSPGMGMSPSRSPGAASQHLHPDPPGTVRHSPAGTPGQATGPPMILASQQLPPSTPSEQERTLDQERSKRKADSQPTPTGQGASKKVKTASVEPEEEHGNGNGNGNTSQDAPAAARRPAPKQQKTISFDEVYQDGAPEHQAYHMIIEYPLGKRNWYILKCDEHGVYFNANPLHGAAKHLHSPQHGMMSKEHSLAIAVLGHLVFDCDAEMAAKNNAMVKEYFGSGHKPFNQNQLTKTERVRRGLEPPGSVRNPPSQRDGKARVPKSVSSRAGIGRGTKGFPGIIYPVPAELYLGYWSKNKTHYGVLVLPWDDLSPCGITGRLKSTNLLGRAPKCYVISKDGEIERWADGYEDGGPLVTKRDFPVMYFDGHRSVGWLRAKDLSPFPFEGGVPQTIPSFDEARDAYAIARGFTGYQHFKVDRSAKGLPEKVTSEVAEPPLAFHANARRSSAEQVDRPAEGPDASPRPIKTQPLPDVSPPEGNAAESDKPDATDVDMLDVAPGDDDSISDSKDMVESDEDVEVAATESRRTSVSNKALAPEGEQSGNVEKTAEQVPQLATDTSALATQIPAGTATQESPKSNGIPQTMDASNTIQQPPSDTAHGTNGAQRHTKDSHIVQASMSFTVATEHHIASRPQSASSSGSKHKVEKMHTRSTSKTRASNSMSPAVAQATLPDRSLGGCAAADGTDMPSKITSPANPAHIMASRTEDTVIARSSPHPGNTATGAKPDEPTETTVDEPLPSPPIAASIEVITTAPVPLPDRTNSAQDDKIHSTPSSKLQLDKLEAYVSRIKSVKGKADSDLADMGREDLATVSNPVSRTSTPTVIRSDAMAQSNRWRAVRNESTTQHLTPEEPLPASATASKEPSPRPSSKDGATASVAVAGAVSGAVADTISVAASTMSTPLRTPSITPKPGGPGKEESFELAWYENSAGVSFSREKDDDPFLILETNSDTNTVETVPGQAVDVTIDPNTTYNMTVEPLDSNNETVMVTLEGVEGEQKLVFEISKAATGHEAIGRIHARRFLNWLNRRRNPNHYIRYNNKTHDPLKKPVTSYVPLSNQSDS